MSISTGWTVRKAAKISRGNGAYIPLGCEVEALEEFSLKQLKSMCKARGLSTNHSRARIVQRLKTYVWRNAPVKAVDVNPRFRNWNCSCGATDCWGSRPTCFKCGKENPARKQAGDWSCPACKAHCFASRKKCFKCGTLNPASVTVGLLADFIAGDKKVVQKAREDFVVAQSLEKKKQDKLRSVRQKQQAAIQAYENSLSGCCKGASSDSGSVTMSVAGDDASSVRSFVPDVPNLVPSEASAGRRKQYFRGGKSYYLLRAGLVRKERDLPKGRRSKPNPEVTTLPAHTRVYVDSVVGTRAKISKPVIGWISTKTKRGDLLAQWNDDRYYSH